MWLLASLGCRPGCGSPPLLAGVRRPRRWPFPWGWVGGFLVVCVYVTRRVRAWCLCCCVCRVFVVVAWVWVCLLCVLVCMCVCVRVWLGPAGACRWCGCGCGCCVSWLVPRHSWRRFLSAISRHSWLGFAAGGGGCSSPLLAEGPGCGSPPLLAGVRWRRWCVVARQSWLRVPVAVPRHSWLGGPLGAVVGGPLPLLAEGLGGGSPPLLAGVRRPRRWVFPWVGVILCCVCLWRGVCAWCLCWCVWCVFVVSVLVVVRVWVCLPRAFVCVCVCVCGVLVACGCRSLLPPAVAVLVGCGWCVLSLVPRHSWRRFLCATPRHSWLDFAAGGGGCSSPLLAEGPRCGSRPLLAGVRRRWCCAAPRHSWLGPAGCGGVFRGWGCPLLCVFVVCVAARCGRAVLCVACLWCPRCWWCGVAVRWVCLPRALVCVVACVWCAGGPWFVVPASFGWGLRLVFVWVWVVCGVGPPPLLAEGPGCCAPPLLAGVRRCAVVVGPLPLLAEGFGCGAPPLLAGVRRRVLWLVPRHSWPRAVGVVPRHSWLRSTSCGGGGPLATPGCGAQGALLLGLGVCVCAVWRLVLVWVACGGRARCGCRVRACVCVRCVVCGVCHTLVGSPRRSAWSWPKSRRKAKKSPCRRVAEMRVMRNAKYIPLYLSHRAFFPL